MTENDGICKGELGGGPWAEPDRAGKYRAVSESAGKYRAVRDSAAASRRKKICFAEVQKSLHQALFCDMI